MKDFMYKDKETWGARAPLAQLQSMNLPVSTIYLHHTVTSVTDDSSADARRVTSYSSYIDVPYTIMVHPNGDVLQGRYKGSVPALGAHTKGQNAVSLGIALIGNYVGEIPTPEALESIARVIESFVEQGNVTPTFTLRSHSEVYATACCGTNLKAQIASIYANAKEYITGDQPAPVVVVPSAPVAPVKDYPAYPMLLKRGAKGGYVIQLQVKLGIKADGDFGVETENTVKAFQELKGLTKDGIVGKNTWNTLFRDSTPSAPAPTPTAIPNYPGLLKKGSRGDIVKLVQQKLKDGGMNIAVDGDFGGKTEQAIRDFQQFKHLTIDGVVGKITWSAIFGG
jgi:peptidoglycan hydrolase-like protein with peptidoglycan-binding domain